MTLPRIVVSEYGLSFGYQNTTRHGVVAKTSAALRKGDILILTGGADIDPGLYNEDNTHSYISLHSRDRDAREADMFERAVELGCPILGICRGHQLIAALRGGALHQELGLVVDAARHGSFHTLHSVKNDAVPTSLSYILERLRRVNSIHHQAVKRVPEGGHIAAISHDGLIECIWYPPTSEYPPMLGVQWHPELMRDESLGRMLAVLHDSRTDS